MARSSYFQTLPECIVESILEYIFVDPKATISQIRPLSLSVLHSCSLWRTLFIRKALSDLLIRLESQPYFEFEYNKWPKDLALPAFPINHLVKKINFSFNCWSDSLDDDYVDKFKKGLAMDAKFASASHLNLTISLNSLFGTDSVLDGLYESLRCLQNMVPRIKRIVVDFAGTDFTDQKASALFFHDFIRSLAKTAPDVTVLGFESFLLHCPNSTIEFSGLTHFTFDSDGESDVYNKIVRRNAGTLKLLIADYEMPGNMDSVLYDQDTPVIYPNMESLTMCFHNDETKSTLTSQSNHFPALKRLTLLTHNSNYPAILFDNPNAAYDTYENLLIHNNAGLFKLALGYHAFTSKALRNLRSVCFHFGRGIDTEHYADQEELDDVNVRLFALTMDASDKLRRLRIKGAVPRDRFMSLLSAPLRFALLEEISISWTELTFPDVLQLIKAAPKLRILRAGIKEEYPSIDGVNASDLITYVESNYENLGKNIRTLFLVCAGNDETLYCYCMIVALLAIACPNIVSLFRRVYKIRDVRNMFSRICESEELSKYAEYYEVLVKKMGVTEQ